MRMIAVLLASVAVTAPAAAAGDAAAGQRAFSRCTPCHSIEPGRNGIGPSLAGIVGSRAATVPGYTFSRQLAAADLTWDDATLDRFLANPQGTVRRNKMFIAVPEEQQRQDIIAYLHTLK